jgi:hypothetical protein
MLFMTALLFLFYPFYLVAWIVTGISFTGSWYWLLVLISFPFFAWSYVQLKPQTDK